MVAAIDIICASWNRSEAIRPTIDSVLAQSFTDWRLIVVSDGSTDDTDDVVRSYTDPRVQLIRSRRYGQAGGPRNDGLAISTAPAIAYLDDDDRWMPDHLAVLQRAFESGARLVSTASFGVNQEGVEQYRTDVLNLVWHPDLQLLWPIYEPSRVGHVRGLPESVGGWTTDQNGFEDWDMWLRLADAGERFTPLPDRTVVMYLSDTSLRHRKELKYWIDLGALPDESACEELTRRLRVPEVQDELRAMFCAASTEFHVDRAKLGELCMPAEVTIDMIVERLEALAKDTSIGMLQDLKFVPEDGEFRVVKPLQCTTDWHADRLRDYLLRHDSERMDFVRRLVKEIAPRG